MVLRRQPVARLRDAFCCLLLPFAAILLPPYLARDQLTHCKHWCLIATKCAKTRRLDSPKTLAAKFGIFGKIRLRRLVLEDCVRRHFYARALCVVLKTADIPLR